MLPLEDFRIVEFGQVAAGPFCGLLLADLGADVIKVEPPQGDMLREWPPILDGYSVYFAAVNRNKRSVTLDLKDPGQCASARALALSADAVIENFRPRVLAKFGLDYSSLSKDKPSLVYCSVSAFGQTGPRAMEGGFDLTIQAMSGIMSVTGEPDGRPVKCAVPLADFGSGLYGAFAVTACLHRARLTGEGQCIDVAMLGAALGISVPQTAEVFGTGNDPVRLGSAHPLNAPYQAFQCRDGHFALAAGSDKLFEAACKVIRRVDLTADRRFATPRLRTEHQEVLRDLLEAEFSMFDAEELLAQFRAAGIPCAPINTYSQAMADPQVVHAGWVQGTELPSGRPVKAMAFPVKLNGALPPIRRRPPALGEHTVEVLAEIQEGARPLRAR